MINFIESGFVSSGDNLPYLSLTKVSNVLDTRDTCTNRIERSIYQIDIYSNTYSSLLDYTDDVETSLDQYDLHAQNRRVLSTQFFSKEITEPKPRIYRSKMEYEVIAQKDFSSSTHEFEFGNGTLYELLKTNLSVDVVTTRFGDSSWVRPFIFIEGYSTEEAWLTTKSRLENTQFTISMEDYSPIDVEDLMEDVDNLISYAKITVNNRRWTSLEWQGDTLIEVEPNLWRGSINYELTLEKDLVA